MFDRKVQLMSLIVIWDIAGVDNTTDNCVFSTILFLLVCFLFQRMKDQKLTSLAKLYYCVLG